MHSLALLTAVQRVPGPEGGQAHAWVLYGPCVCLHSLLSACCAVVPGPQVQCTRVCGGGGGWDGGGGGWDGGGGGGRSTLDQLQGRTHHCPTHLTRLRHAPASRAHVMCPHHVPAARSMRRLWSGSACHGRPSPTPCSRAARWGRWEDMGGGRWDLWEEIFDLWEMGGGGRWGRHEVGCGVDGNCHLPPGLMATASRHWG